MQHTVPLPRKQDVLLNLKRTMIHITDYIQTSHICQNESQFIILLNCMIPNNLM